MFDERAFDLRAFDGHMKPDFVIPADWTTGEREQFRVKGYRYRRNGERPVSDVVRPEDYAHDLQRGDMEWLTTWFNYSLQTVTIPNGTTINECNFSQWMPMTDAITGLNLTFVDCNLVNCQVHPSWTLIRCNTVQAWLCSDGGDEYRVWVCAHPDQWTNPTPPGNVVPARTY